MFTRTKLDWPSLESVPIIMGSRWFASRNFGAGVKKRFSTPVRPQAICEHSVKGQGAFRLPVTTTSATNEEMIFGTPPKCIINGAGKLKFNCFNFNCTQFSTKKERPLAIYLHANLANGATSFFIFLTIQIYIWDSNRLFDQFGSLIGKWANQCSRRLCFIVTQANKAFIEAN